MRSSRVFGPVVVLLCLLGVDPVRARPVAPEPVPVRRLVASLSERILKNPNDVQGVFTLGRVHYFAFAGATDVVRVLPHGDQASLPRPYDLFGERGKGMSARGSPTAAVTEADRVAHLKEALTHLHRATSMKTSPGEQDGRYQLCLACALEEGAPYAAKVGSVAGVEATEQAWLDAAIRYYGLAFDRAVDEDRTIKERPLFGLATLVSFEAGNSYERLVKARGGPPTPDEQSRIARIAQFRAEIDNLRPGPVTPLIFALNRRAHLPDLLSGRVVSIDLNGSNLPQHYGWVRPDTAILIWDPGATGIVTSGRQMFGSVTWWMFWDHAYQALRVLDDDRSGWVEGSELAGLALWFDRDEDGSSGEGEVVPIEATPISGIATEATGRAGLAPMNAAGLRLRDGSLLPTYDWIATPQPPGSRDSRRTVATSPQ